MNDKEVQKKTIYNPDSKESINDRQIIGGDPDGMINFTKMKYGWALKLWDTMEANTWFPKEVALTQDAKDYKMLLPAEKRMYDLVLAQLIFMDSLQANNIMDNVNPYVTASEVNACLSRQAYEECLTFGHEVLTENGWKDISIIKEGDTVLSYDIASNTSSFQAVTKVHNYTYSGKLHHFKGTTFEQITTDGHRIPYVDRNKVVQCKLANKFSEGSQEVGFKNSANFKSATTKPTIVFEDFHKFLVALQADGTILQDSDNGTNVDTNGSKSGMISCTFSFSEQRKIDRLTDILNKTGFNYVVKAYSNNIENKLDQTMFTVQVPLDYTLTKNFTEWLNLGDIDKTFAKAFIAELRYWDDHNYRSKIKTNIFGYDTTLKDDADIVHAIGVLAGYRINHSIVINTKKDTYEDLHRLSFNDTLLNTEPGAVTKTVTVCEDINVYCLSVPDSFFVVRYNNKVSITGNCNHSKSYAVMVESISENTDHIYDLWKKDEMLRRKDAYIADMFLRNFDNFSGEQKLLLSFIANQILEGLYFYTGFAAMYALGKSGKMLGSTQMIRFIQRDEVTHLILFENMILSIRKEKPHLFTAELEEKVRDMFRGAVEMESEWGKYITQGQILGFTDQIITKYVQLLADRRLVAIGYEKEYNVDHPMPWVDVYASFNEQRVNFFEGNVINYSKGSLEDEEF